MSKTQELYGQAKKIIPRGTQLLSKSPEQFAPGFWPAYFQEARGCEVWDLDGKHYYDMSLNGIGACLLGFADPDVNDAVIERVKKGSMCTLNPPEEVELAELLCEIHPWAEQVRFTRGGGEACAVAVRIARAATGRSVVAVCGYHGWCDWYLAANLAENEALNGHLMPGLNPIGVPKELINTNFAFSFNDKNTLEKIVNRFGDDLSCIIMEPCRHHDPEPGFLEYARDVATRCGSLLIFDEITIGWRLQYGGTHLKFGVQPDIAVFAKALGNGHPAGAIIGTTSAMEGAHNSFISSTYWTESVGPAAALATLKKLKTCGIVKHIENIGKKVMDSWEFLAKMHKLPVVTNEVYPCLASFRFNHEEYIKLNTLYTRLMLEKGFLAGSAIYPTLAHTEENIQQYAEAIDETFAEIAEILSQGKLDHILKGNIAQKGFHRLV